MPEFPACIDYGHTHQHSHFMLALAARIVRYKRSCAKHTYIRVWYFHRNLETRALHKFIPPTKGGRRESPYGMRWIVAGDGDSSGSGDGSGADGGGL